MLAKVDNKNTRISKLYEEYLADPRNELVFYKGLFAVAKKRILPYEYGAPVATANTADDYAQEAVIGVWKGLPKFEGDGKAFECWFNTIISNKLSRFWKEIKKQQETKESLITVGKDAETGESFDMENIKIYANHCGGQRLQIPQEVQGIDRNICELILDGKDYKQIARLLSMTVDAVDARLRRLKSKLRG